MRAGIRGVGVQLGLVAVAVLGGCHAGSLEPVYLPADVVEAPVEALGSWVQVAEKDKEPAELVVSGTDRRALDVLLRSDGEEVTLRAVPFKGPGGPYLDITARADVLPLKAYSAYVLRPHFLARVELKGDALSVAFPARAFVRKITSGKGALHAHALGTSKDEDFLLFTSTSTELSRALSRHQATRDAWEAPVLFARKK